MAAIDTSAAAAFAQHAVQEQLVDLLWYHASDINQLQALLAHAAHIPSGQESTPDLSIAARTFVHRLPCRLKCTTITVSLDIY